MWTVLSSVEVYRNLKAFRLSNLRTIDRAQSQHKTAGGCRVLGARSTALSRGSEASCRWPWQLAKDLRRVTVNAAS